MSMRFYSFAMRESMTKKKISENEALHLMYKFCAYRERSHREVRTKLLDMQIYGDALEEIIASLISDGFLNEERFARAFVSGKFRIKKWGRRKIQVGLKQHQISDYALKKAWEEIDEHEYEITMRTLIEKKWSQTSASNDFLRQQKVGKFMIQKGYEPELVWGMLKRFNK